MDLLDKKIVKIMQDEFPLIPEPYKYFAEKLCIKQEELLNRLQKLKDEGKIRKMGAVLRHVKSGFKSNCLVAWQVEPERLDEVGRAMARVSQISHCYDRVTAPNWPYNIYTMIHASSREEIQALVKELAEKFKLTNYELLYSQKEWKKTSMSYFEEIEV